MPLTNIAPASEFPAKLAEPGNQFVVSGREHILKVMSRSVKSVEPYKSQQVVIVFKKGLAASDATLGYYGTIARVFENTIARYPSRPSEWIYRVYVPYFKEYYDLPAKDLVLTECADAQELPSESACKVRFASEVAEDHSEIHGAYQVPTRDWDYFLFKKRDQLHDSYELRLPMDGRPATLYYYVPADLRLNCDFVLRAVAEIISVGDWQRCKL